MESSVSRQNATPSPPPDSSSFPSSPHTMGPNQADVTKAQPMRLTTKICPLQVHLHPQGKAKNYLWQAEQWPPKDMLDLA